jgi:hypothetical protein
LLSANDSRCDGKKSIVVGRCPCFEPDALQHSDFTQVGHFARVTNDGYRPAAIARVVQAIGLKRHNSMGYGREKRTLSIYSDDDVAADNGEFDWLRRGHRVFREDDPANRHRPQEPEAFRSRDQS